MEKQNYQLNHITAINASADCISISNRRQMKGILIALCLGLIPSFTFAQVEIAHQLKAKLNSNYKFSQNGNYLLIGNELDGLGKGAVKVLETKNGTEYELSAQLKGKAFMTGFGYAIDISSDGNRIVVSAPKTAPHGLVYLYEKEKEQWALSQVFSPTLPASNFGQSIALAGDGKTLAVGAPSYFDDSNPGRCFVFDLTTKDSIHQPLIITPPKNEKDFGRQVKISAHGNIVAIGSSTKDWKERCAGAINIFQRADSLYQPLGDRIVLPKDSCYHFATQLALSQDGLTIASGLSSKRFSALVWKYNQGNWKVMGSGIPAFGGTRDHSPIIDLEATSKSIVLSKAKGEKFGEAMLYHFTNEDWKLAGTVLKSKKGMNKTMAYSFRYNIMLIEELIETSSSFKNELSLIKFE